MPITGTIDLEDIKKLLQQGARVAPDQQTFAPKDMEPGNVPFHPCFE